MSVTPDLAMGLLDGCPSCVMNTEAPRSAVAVDNGWRCAYLCADCGHAWTTDWAEKALVLSGNRAVSEGGKWDNGGTSESGPGRCVNTVAPRASPTSKESTSA